MQRRPDVTTDDIDPSDIAEDGSLAPNEKETHFRFAKDQDRVIVSTGVRGVMQSLVRRDDFTITQTRYDEEAGRYIHLFGTLPLTVLKIQATPRSGEATWTDIISTHGHGD